MLEQFRSVLKSRNALMLLLASVTSTLGDWAYFVAISVYFVGRGQTEWLAALATLHFACTFLLAPIGGALAERWPKRATMLGSDLLRFAIMLGLGLAMWQGAPAAFIASLAALSSCAGLCFSPARRALLPTTVDTEHRLALNALDGSIGVAALTIAPALAGVALVWISPAAVVAVNGASFVISALFVSLIAPGRSSEPAAPVTKRSLRADVREGLVFIVRAPEVSAITALAFISHVAVGATWVFVPAICLRLGLPESATGYLSAAIGLGSFAGMLAGGRLARGRELKAAFVAVLAFAVAFGLWGLLQASVIGAFAGALLLGFTANLFEAPCWSVLQDKTDPGLYARVFSGFDAITLIGMAVGTQTAAWTLARSGTGPGIAVVAALMLFLFALNFAGLRLRRQEVSV